MATAKPLRLAAFIRRLQTIQRSLKASGVEDPLMVYARDEEGNDHAVIYQLPGTIVVDPASVGPYGDIELAEDQEASKPNAVIVN